MELPEYENLTIGDVFLYHSFSGKHVLVLVHSVSPDMSKADSGATYSSYNAQDQMWTRRSGYMNFRTYKSLKGTRFWFVGNLLDGIEDSKNVWSEFIEQQVKLGGEAG